MKLEGKRVAIVADWLTSRGGAERVIFSLMKLFPDAVLFTSVYNESQFPELNRREVRTTWLQKLPRGIRNRHQFLLPFFPGAFRKLDLSEFDIIISSSSSGFSKCVRKTRSDQIHVCYCHTPVRFLYHAREEYETDFPLPWWARPFRIFLPGLLNRLTKIDQKAAQSVDYWLSNSDFVGKRISEFYHVESKTIYPGVETTPFTQAAETTSAQDYFLAVGRFIPYKKFDLLVETFVKNGLLLKLAGRGPEWERCKALAKGAENIEFLGFVSDADLPGLYAGARAFLFPAEEDFGLTPIESMSAGTPVIYYAQGGAVESVGQWGISFDAQTVDSLQQSLNQFLDREQDLEITEIIERGNAFDEQWFRKKIKSFLEII